MAVNKLGQSMVGSKAPKGVKKPAKVPASLKGSKIQKFASTPFEIIHH